MQFKKHCSKVSQILYEERNNNTAVSQQSMPPESFLLTLSKFGF